MEVPRDAGAAGAANYKPSVETLVSVGRQGGERILALFLDSFLPWPFLPNPLVLIRGVQAAALSETVLKSVPSTRCHLRVNDLSLNLSATQRTSLGCRVPVIASWFMTSSTSYQLLFSLLPWLCPAPLSPRARISFLLASLPSSPQAELGARSPSLSQILQHQILSLRTQAWPLSLKPSPSSQLQTLADLCSSRPCPPQRHP